MQKIITHIQHMYEQWGVTDTSLKLLSMLTTVLLALLAMALASYLLRKHVEPLINKITYKTENKWDDILLSDNVLKWIWIILPLVIGYKMLPPAFTYYPTWGSIISVILQISIVLTVMMLVIQLVKAVFLLIGDRDNIAEIAQQMHEAEINGEEFEYKPSHSLKGLQQMMTIVIIAFSVIMCISILFGKDPLIILSGLGAAAAIIMLVFQDSILGVVAGIQLTANDMLQPGDWIIAPKYQANGIVQEVTLAAVKVQNWDKTIITIPPYHLLTEGFQNWKGMQQSHGRRVMRSINIDLSTIRHANEREVATWSQQPWWRPLPEGMQMVNISALRLYLEYFLTTVPTFRENMLYMIRELQPTAEGLPVEIYFFTGKTDWKSYELVQANVMDQIIASVPMFGLRLFQNPSGHDIRSLRETTGSLANTLGL